MLDKLSAKQVTKQITKESNKAHKKHQKLAQTTGRSAADTWEDDGSSIASSLNEVDLKIHDIKLRADDKIHSAAPNDRAKIEEKRWKDIAKT